MMITKEDFKISSKADLIDFLPIAVVGALLAPILIVAYTIGFVMDKTGWLKTST